MLKTRVIPCLLVSESRLVKTVQFKKPRYVGDPVNAVKIFNDKEVDEIVVLDIDATRSGREPDLDLIGELASECFMPLAYGGGINKLETARRILKLGVEKIILNTAAWKQPALVRDAANEFGSQAVAVSIDVKRKLFGRYEVCVDKASKATGEDPVTYARRMQALGAGEILLNSVQQDGTLAGYDLELISRVASAVNVPVIASGGAGTVEHFREAVQRGGASAVAAGSMFVFHGPHRAVLITYPDRAVLESTLA
ncbi:MAG TPA: AglZ/HisF2 family acetamidino modification protein [Noviherbaspirillum sp.]|jgi:cyclase|uniref:AglZ/HisF2 family acetamidino modification protein n=1 Tax=Noviherbaspirillum sp. TaxID=1926288 RepID=UPI002F941B0A